jgi:hypothetical protein
MKRLRDEISHPFRDNKSINKKICNIKSSHELIKIYQIRYNEFNHINISALICRFAKLSVKPDQEFINILIKEVKSKIYDFNPQSISNIFWAFGKLNIRNMDMINILSKEIKYKIHVFNSQNISNIFLSFAKLNIKNIDAINILAKELKYKIHDFNSQDISNTLWALATLNNRDVDLINILIKEIKYKIQDFNIQNITNTLWSLSVLDVYYYNIFKELIKKITFEKIITSELMQLKYVYLYLKYDVRSHLYKLIDISKPIKSKNIVSSKFHLDCAKYLKVPFKNEVSINGLVCDICLSKDRIILEINGPSHYIYNTKELLGNTQFKNRLLTCMGYKVKIVPYWDWRKLRTHKEKRSYLQNLLS